MKEKKTAITAEAQAPPALLFHCAVEVWRPSIRHTKATSLGATKQGIFKTFYHLQQPPKYKKQPLQNK